MSAFGANLNATSPFRKAEIELEKSGINYNIIRPNWFMQNFNSFWIKGILEQSKILLPAGNAHVSFIDSRDISAVASKLLASDDYNNTAFDLTGPEAITHNNVANYNSNVTGKNIKYQEISSADFKTDLLQSGLNEDYSNFLVTIMNYLRSGYSSSITNSVAEILGRKAINFKKYAEDYKKSWV